MRRIRSVALAGVFLAVASLVLADYQVAGDTVYPVSRPIAKIYAHRLGYKVVFERENGAYGTFYVPMDWFGRAGGMGEIVWGTELAYPKFTAFYVDGKFSHIRLYVQKDQSDQSWGLLRATTEEEQKFQIETLEIPY